MSPNINFYGLGQLKTQQMIAIDDKKKLLVIPNIIYWLEQNQNIFLFLFISGFVTKLQPKQPNKFRCSLYSKFKITSLHKS